MIDDRKLLLRDGVIDALLTADAADLARLGWQEPDRVRAVLDRIAQASSSHTDSALAGLGHTVVPSGRYALLDALARLGFEEGLRPFEQADLLDLFGRWALVHYLLTDPLFLTIDELAEVIVEYADHLEANRSSLIRRGVPETSLGASYPGTLLSYLYPTKIIYMENQTLVEGPELASPRDRALKHLPAAKRATRVHAYWWLQGEPSTSGQDMVLDEPYEDAVRLRHLEEQDAARLEAGRAAFLDLEIDVLRALAKALRRGDATKLWEESLNLLSEGLLADDAAFYLRMDQRFYGYDIASGKEKGKGYLSVYPGGLSNLLIVIGHCEKELTIGTMDRTKRLMPPAVLDDASFRSYFQAIGQPWQPELDRPLDHLIEQMGQEDAFWTEFQERVNEAIPAEFTAPFNLSMAIKHKYLASFERQMKAFGEWTLASLELTGALPELQLTLQAASPVESMAETNNEFRKESDNWMVRYAGLAVQIPVGLSGFDYLAFLLHHPGRAFEVQVFDAEIRGNLGPGRKAHAALSLSKPDGFRIGGIGDAGELTDEKTIKAARARLHELKSELKNALACGNTGAVDKIRSDEAVIKRYLSETVGLHSRPRKANDPRSKARINIQRLIRRAIDLIAEKHPALGLHLRASVKTGNYCIYDPPLNERVAWTY